MNLTGKTIVLGVTGGIAAYKAANLCSDLCKTGADVHVIMTENATQFVSSLTFETLSGNRVSVDAFDRNFQWNVQHVALAKKADVLLIAPATANILAKMATGLADDMLSTTVLAASCPKIVAPAMNTGMYENPVTQKNIETLRGYGVVVVEPQAGFLACGDMGKGRLAELDLIKDAVFMAVTAPKDMQGMRVLVTAGPTCEAMDPVRYITNHSSGKMGYEMAKAARMRGAEVILVSGRTALPKPIGMQVVDIFSAQEMYTAVMEHASECDIIIKAAAVADYRPKNIADEKIKKKEDADASVPLERTKDILFSLGQQKKQGQILCGFSMETENMVENSKGKLTRKNADMIVANNLKVEGAGFQTNTNIVSIITQEGVEELDIMSKETLSNVILDRILALKSK